VEVLTRVPSFFKRRNISREKDAPLSLLSPIKKIINRIGAASYHLD